MGVLIGIFSHLGNVTASCKYENDLRVPVRIVCEISIEKSLVDFLISNVENSEFLRKKNEWNAVYLCL